MGRLDDMLEQQKQLIISGPYGTEVAERVAKSIIANPQLATNVPRNKYLTADSSALLTHEGCSLLSEIACDYASSSPHDVPIVIVTPSFRLAKEALKAASQVRGFDPNLPKMGLDLCLDAIRLCYDAIDRSGRNHNNTLVAMTIGPPFDCYRGENTPPDIAEKYLPQTFAAVRFGNSIDYLMFETVPSLAAAIGAAHAFNKAHGVLDIEDNLSNFQNVETISYLGNILHTLVRTNMDPRKVAVGFDKHRHAFSEIEATKDYIVYLCLRKDATLGGMDLNDAIGEFYNSIERKGWIAPVGLGINCNSPALTHEALSQLNQRNLSRVIGVHPNASSEQDPLQYTQMRMINAIPNERFVEAVASMANSYGLKILGGCCGTDHHTMRSLIAKVNC